jgi:hypothetical protein
MIELIPFLSMFLSFIIVFLLIQYILSNEVEEGDETYPGVDSISRMFLQTVRISVGDLKNIDYTKWADDSS